MSQKNMKDIKGTDEKGDAVNIESEKLLVFLDKKAPSHGICLVRKNKQKAEGLQDVISILVYNVDDISQKALKKTF